MSIQITAARSPIRRAPGRPTTEDSEALRQAVTQAALEEFVGRGFEYGNVNHVAAKAGVTKATVYRLYGSKENLFKVAIRSAIERSRLSHWKIDSDLDLEVVLRDAAVRISHAYTSGLIWPLWHSVLAVKRRFPDFYEEVLAIVRSESNAAALAKFLEDLRQRGLVDVDDPWAVAHHFSLLVGQGRELGLPAGHDAQMEADRVAGIVKMFVLALRPAAQGPTAQ